MALGGGCEGGMEGGNGGGVGHPWKQGKKNLRGKHR